MDKVSSAAGKVSHAVRMGLGPDVIAALRQDLFDARLERDIARLLAEGMGPSMAKATELCAMLMDSAAA